VDQDAFLRLVQEALDLLPEEFAERLWNLQVAVEPEPSRTDLEELGLGPCDTLLGLYRGVPLTERGGDLSASVPDLITIYQGPIERRCDGDAGCIREQVRETVLHEVAHYFGIDDDRLEELDRA
jgi:predicted Zn-dependent protease with MMP-like domain